MDVDSEEFLKKACKAEAIAIKDIKKQSVSLDKMKEATLIIEDMKRSLYDYHVDRSTTALTIIDTFDTVELGKIFNEHFKDFKGLEFKKMDKNLIFNYKILFIEIVTKEAALKNLSLIEFKTILLQNPFILCKVMDKVEVEFNPLLKDSPLYGLGQIMINYFIDIKNNRLNSLDQNAVLLLKEAFIDLSKQEAANLKLSVPEFLQTLQNNETSLKLMMRLFISKLQELN